VLLRTAGAQWLLLTVWFEYFFSGAMHFSIWFICPAIPWPNLPFKLSNPNPQTHHRWIAGQPVTNPTVCCADASIQRNICLSFTVFTCCFCSNDLRETCRTLFLLFIFIFVTLDQINININQLYYCSII
jgi:hypothetical protein